jgi:hypothetical protein
LVWNTSPHQYFNWLCKIEGPSLKLKNLDESIQAKKSRKNLMRQSLQENRVKDFQCFMSFCPGTGPYYFKLNHLSHKKKISHQCLPET